MIGIGQQREGDSVLVRELGLALLVEDADAEHGRFSLLERGQLPLNLARLLGAARRVVLGIEVQNQRLALVVGELVRGAGLIFERERGGLLAGIDERHMTRNNTSFE